jgi:hypothetical protein
MGLTDDISDAFLLKYDGICTDVEMPRAQGLGLMESESDIHANKTNPGGKATGLIQFDNWDSHGLLVMPSGKHMRWQDVAAESDEDQLDEVRAFFAHYRGHLSQPGQAYTAAFLPVQALSSHFGPAFVVCGSRPGDPYPNAYKCNPGFDRGRRGYITGADMAARTDAMIARPRVQELLARLTALVAPDDGQPSDYGA